MTRSHSWRFNRDWTTNLQRGLMFTRNLKTRLAYKTISSHSCHRNLKMTQRSSLRSSALLLKPTLTSNQSNLATLIWSCYRLLFRESKKKWSRIRRGCSTGIKLLKQSTICPNWTERLLREGDWWHRRMQISTIIASLWLSQVIMRAFVSLNQSNPLIAWRNNRPQLQAMPSASQIS